MALNSFNPRFGALQDALVPSSVRMMIKLNRSVGQLARPMDLYGLSRTLRSTDFVRAMALHAGLAERFQFVDRHTQWIDAHRQFAGLATASASWSEIIRSVEALTLGNSMALQLARVARFDRGPARSGGAQLTRFGRYT